MNKTVRPAQGVLFQELDGEAVLLSTRTGQYYGLNELGARIWSEISNGIAMPDLISAVMSDYEVEEEQLASDVAKFVDNLRRAGLVQMARHG